MRLPKLLNRNSGNDLETIETIVERYQEQETWKDKFNLREKEL